MRFQDHLASYLQMYLYTFAVRPPHGSEGAVGEGACLGWILWVLELVQPLLLPSPVTLSQHALSCLPQFPHECLAQMMRNGLAQSLAQADVPVP